MRRRPGVVEAPTALTGVGPAESMGRHEAGRGSDVHRAGAAGGGMGAPQPLGAVAELGHAQARRGSPSDGGGSEEHPEWDGNASWTERQGTMRIEAIQSLSEILDVVQDARVRALRWDAVPN